MARRMKIIIAGSRSIYDYKIVRACINDCIAQNRIEITTIISGNAIGVDKLGEKYAEEYKIDTEKYPANWNLYGKSAGYKRNVTMAERADGLIAIWDGGSVGTKHMIDIARKKGLDVWVYGGK